MATAQFQSRSSYRLGNGTSLPVPTPGGTLNGDLLILAVAYANYTIGTPTVPAGYTQFLFTNTGTTSTDIVRIFYWKEAYNEGTTQQVTIAGTGTSCDAACWRISGADVSNPIGTTAVAYGTGTTVTAPSLTTTLANQLVCWFGESSNATATTFTTPTGYTQHDDPSSSAMTWGDGEQLLASAGTLGSDSGTTNGVAGDKWIAVKFSLFSDVTAVPSCHAQTSNPVL